MHLVFSQGLAAVVVDGKWGYIDMTGAFVIPAHYGNNAERADKGTFSEGLAAIQTDGGTWGYIDRTGAPLIPARFDAAEPFAEGLAKVQIDGKWGYIDTTGKQVIGPQFAVAASFSHGLAYVTTDTADGYIDRAGMFVWQRTIYR